jgi:hypothetical protein
MGGKSICGNLFSQWSFAKISENLQIFPCCAVDLPVFYANISLVSVNHRFVEKLVIFSEKFFPHIKIPEIGYLKTDGLPNLTNESWPSCT